MNTPQELTQELLTRFDAMAAKLGTTTEYLWPLLVKQQIVEGWASVLCGVLMLAVVGGFWYVMVKHKLEDMDSYAREIVGVAGGIVSGLIVLIALCLLFEVVHIITPEAYAFQELIK